MTLAAHDSRMEHTALRPGPGRIPIGANKKLRFAERRLGMRREGEGPPQPGSAADLATPFVIHVCTFSEFSERGL